MTMRIEGHVTRQAPFTIHVDGEALTAYPGETIATVMIERAPAFRKDSRERDRGLFCNMGTCSECLVTLLPTERRVRACITPVLPGMEIRRG